MGKSEVNIIETEQGDNEMQVGEADKDMEGEREVGGECEVFNALIKQVEVE